MNEACLRLILEVILQPNLRRAVFETEIYGHDLEILSHRRDHLLEMGSLLRDGCGGGIHCLRS